jgi:hypothetical protein
VGWKADVRHVKQIGTGQDVLARDAVGTSHKVTSPLSFPRLALTIRAHQLNDDAVGRHVKEQNVKKQRATTLVSVYHSCLGLPLLLITCLGLPLLSRSTTLVNHLSRSTTLVSVYHSC